MASCWFTEIFSAGFLKSPILAMVIIHLNVGAQKKTNKRGVNENRLDTGKRTCWMNK
jgi:hypothetical protein